MLIDLQTQLENKFHLSFTDKYTTETHISLDSDVDCSFVLYRVLGLYFCLSDTEAYYPLIHLKWVQKSLYFKKIAADSEICVFKQVTF